MSGDKTINQHGVYGTKGVPDTENYPGSREGSVSWVDTDGNLWVFGGLGYAESSFGLLNDLWRFGSSQPDGQIPSTEDDDDGGENGEKEAELPFSLIIIVIFLIIAFIFGLSGYIVFRRKQKKPKELKQKKPKGVINCPFCFKKIEAGESVCSYCGTNIRETGEKYKEIEEKHISIENYIHTFERIIGKNVILNISNKEDLKLERFENMLNRIFLDEEEKEVIRSEIHKLPKGTFKDFLNSYFQVIKELEIEGPKSYLNNDDYIKEARGK